MAIQFNPLVHEIRSRSRYHGMYSRVARKLGLTPQHVRRVAMGLTTSARVMRALAAEMRRIEKQSEAAA